MDKLTLRKLVMGTTALVVLVAGYVVPGVSTAQADDAAGLSSRLERIERDLMVLQRQIYRSQVDGGPSATVAPSSSKPSSAVVKVGELEEQIRDLTGQVETLMFQIQQNKERMDRMNADIDFRLQRLEGKDPTATKAGDPSSQLVPPAANQSDSKVILTPPVPPQPTADGNSVPKLTIPTEAKPSGDPREDYNAAFRVLQKGDYPGAEAAFSAFLTNHKDHALAGNASYWLGETYYVRGQFEKAAVTFADAYKSYRKSPKAPDSLLKLGFSMRKLGKEQQSCAAYGQLLKEYPNSSKVIVQLAQTARKELKCP